MKKRSATIGLPPGSLVHVGDIKSSTVSIKIIDYTEIDIKQKQVQNIEECFIYKDSQSVSWINIDGINQTTVIEAVGKNFDLHPLILEDIVNTGQRPKIEEYEQYLFIVLKMLSYNEQMQQIEAEQVSLVLGPKYVLSFQEREGDIFDPIRKRLTNEKNRFRKKGADFLAYSLLDAIIDNYFIILEKIGGKIEDLEEVLIDKPTPETLQNIHRLKGELIFLRKSVWPLREVINGIQRSESALIQSSTQIYLRDIHDHTIQVIDTIESYRDITSGMLDIYMSSVSNKMNEVMKILTIFAAIFIPLTFIAGIYGMNFNPQISPFNMPELQWYLGYPFALMIMFIVSMIMILFFKRRNWL